MARGINCLINTSSKCCLFSGCLTAAMHIHALFSKSDLNCSGSCRQANMKITHVFIAFPDTCTCVFILILSGGRGGNSLNDKICTLGFILHVALILPFVKHIVMCYNLADTFVIICLNVSVYLTEIICRSLFVNVICSHSPSKTVG